MTTTNSIRQTFLDHFAKADHQVVASSPLVPHNDPTLMFTNAGMNQFKNIFTGAEVAKFPRAVSSQKCVRAGGKHNDLDNVGYTARHHTFFEMLGNFSFGDYFKEQAIEHAWNLITKEYGISADKLGVTVYHTDDEAFNLWKKIAGLPESKILRVPTKDNFWSMGDTGPCGPCTEIFYDHGVGEGEWKLDSTGHDMFGGRFVEVWNLVFMQFEAQADGTQIPLPKPSIDTGMGLERIAAVLQGKHNNFDIDLFQALIRASESVSGTKAEGVRLPSHRIIADHLRASSFLMADGVMPSNEGRGYVLRRIMRRAMRHAHQLGCKEPLMHKLVPALVAEMGDAYPELKRAQAMIVENLRLEEERFKQTLERGLKLLDEESANVPTGGALKGDVAFKLYDTFGFPLDLTEDILRGQDKKVDSDGFAACMAEQKARARAAWSGSGETATSKLWFELKDQFGATEFLGYTQQETVAHVLALVQNDASVGSASEGKAFIITNQTPFYGESGGQVGDAGVLLRGADIIGEITDTQKPLPDFFVHHVTLTQPLKVGDEVTLRIDNTRRDRIRANHSATHILHAVLHRVLGAHVTQKGSLVSADRLRFDISHPKALTKEEISTVEARVNHIIWQNSEVSTRLMTPDAAIEAGAMALFGEKYGDEVRVLSMGLHEEEASKSFSVELCGGTHVARTGDIGLFKIVSEGALAAGIRRIEAVTQAGALEYLSGQDAKLRDLALELKVAPDQVHERLTALMAERKKLEKDLADAKRKLAMGSGGADAGEKETIGNITFASRVFEDLAPGDLRPLAEQMLKELGSGVVVVATGFEGKASLVAAVSADITAQYSAVDLVKAGVEVVGGKGGGGKPNMAQGGGPDASNLANAIAAMKQTLTQKAAA